MRLSLPLSTILLLSCTGSSAPPEQLPELEAEDVHAFVARADKELKEAWVARDSAYWTYETDITDAHQAAAAAQDEKSLGLLTRLVQESKKVTGEPDALAARQLHLLRLSTAMPAPDDAAKRAELTTITTGMSGTYGKGKYCFESGECLDLEGLEKILAESRDADKLLEVWDGWRKVSPPMKDDYARFVELTNEGAKDLGFSDLGVMWRSGYDMEPEAVEAEADRLWKQVEPLYEQLHCYVRAELEEQYGPEVVPGKTIPAHLTGNMWAQEWAYLYPMATPYPDAKSFDLDAALVASGWDEREMVRKSEAFFTSMGLDPLPATFWERSMFTKPEGKEAVCHASAWDVQWSGDLRIKMCIDPTAEEFRVIHHELGHDYYFMYYHHLPVLLQNGAHDGFHEAIGDAIALSITPAYLHQIGLIDETEASQEAVINEQMRVALDKLAFLPFGRMIDQWRWEVFSGRITPETYNSRWWELREQYQGVSAPNERPADAFDPGAKYHIPANTPYLRYFFAHILQFQMHAAMCEAAGHEGPLYACSVYGSEAAGERLKAMLAMGASEPWPEALQALTGSREMSAEPLVTYFEPLMGWLQTQNEGRECGW